MKPTKTVTINGRKYNAATGLPIAKDLKNDTPPKAAVTKITSVQSLSRQPKLAKKPNAKKSISALRPRPLKPGVSMDIARSKNITHFAPRTTNTTKTRSENKDITPRKHPLILSAEKRLLRKNSQKAIAQKSSKDLKNEAIQNALDQSGGVKPKRTGFFKRHTKLFNVFTISAFLVILAGYSIYTSMPGISVKIASAQAGIEATYPDYKPDGYSLDGPVTFSEGQVTIKFHSNTGNSEFTITQAKSAWDSVAVKNQVNKDSNGEFITTEENGLTIFTYNGNASWVNGGILYTINGNTHLSGEQIRHIATSL